MTSNSNNARSSLRFSVRDRQQQTRHKWIQLTRSWAVAEVDSNTNCIYPPFLPQKWRPDTDFAKPVCTDQQLIIVVNILFNLAYYIFSLRDELLLDINSYILRINYQTSRYASRLIA